MNKLYKIFDAYKLNSVGVWYFIPNEGAFKAGKPCKGFGAIKPILSFHSQVTLMVFFLLNLSRQVRRVRVLLASVLPFPFS